MKAQDPRRQTRRYTEERIVEIRGELAVVEACAGPAPEVWKIVEEELLDELAELELSLVMGEPVPCARRRLSSPRAQGRWRA